MVKIRIISVIILFFLLLNLQAAKAQSGWVRQNSGTTLNLLDLQFINSNTGFIVGQNNGSPAVSIFLKTTNGGVNWFSSNFPLESFYSVGFIDVSTGIIFGAYNFRRTTNGSSSWTSGPNPSNSAMSKILFKNSTVGFAFGTSFIDNTTDAGLTWQRVLPANKIFLNDAVFLTQNKAIAVGQNSFTSTNGGLTWTYNSSLYSQFGISNCDSNNVMTCGQYLRGICKSSNGGTKWTIVYPGTETDTSFLSVKYLDVNNAIVTGYGGKILYTSNGGSSWTQQASGVGTTLMRITFTNSLTGWIVGKNGVILKTTTGGVVTGFTQSSSEIPDRFSLSQNYPNPFNPNTFVSYQLRVAGFISLKVYDALGNEVETLVNDKQNAGSYSVTFEAAKLPSGIYFYTLRTENFSETKRMVLVK